MGTTPFWCTAPGNIGTAATLGAFIAMLSGTMVRSGPACCAQQLQLLLDHSLDDG
jgi:hypothetical protein